MTSEKGNAVAKRIKIARKAKSLSLEKFGKKIGVTTTTAHRYETGERQPRYGVLFKMADVLDVPINFLLDYPEKKVIDVTGLTEPEIQVLHDLVKMVKGRKKERLEENQNKEGAE